MKSIIPINANDIVNLRKTRKTVIATILATVVLGFGVHAQTAYTLADDDVVVENGTITSCSYDFSTNANGTNLTVPDQLDGQAVIAIADGTVQNNTGEDIFGRKNIVAVTLPATLQTIGDYAFVNCGLTSVAFEPGSQLKTIGAYSFIANELQSIAIPDAVASIGDNAFGNNRLSTVAIPNSIEHIGNYAFQNNSLTNLTFDPVCQLQTIGYYAFNRNSLSAVSIPRSVTYIDIYAFGNNSITTVQFEENSNIEDIKSNAFSGNANLTSIAFPAHANNDFLSYKDGNNNAYNAGDAITDFAVDYYANVFYTLTDDDVVVTGGIIQSCSYDFSVNDRGTNLNIPQTLDGQTVIGIASGEDYESGIFANKDILFVALPSTLQTIGNYAFNSNSLTTVDIPATTIKIGAASFDGNALATVDFETGSHLQAIDSSAFGDNNLDTIALPGSVVEIGNDAFKNNELKHLSIPGSVASIGFAAFSDNALEIVEFENGALKTIDSAVFRNNSLTSVTIPNTVEKIGAYAFQTNSLRSVIFESGSTLVAIGDYAFVGNKIVGLNIPNSVVEIGSNAFIFNALTTLTFEPGSHLQIIGDFAFTLNKINTLSIPPSIITIGENAFWYNGLSNIVFETGCQVKTIRSHAFLDNALRNLTIPNSIVEIGVSAFCRNTLESVTFEAGCSLTEIGKSVFGDNSLTAIDIPQSITKIDDSAFENNKLANIAIPESVAYIGYSAFMNNALTSIHIPDSVTEIGAYAFKTNLLTSVTFEANSKIVNIYAGAFADNSGLKSIVLPTNANAGFIDYQDGVGNGYDAGDSITIFGTNYFANMPYILADDDVVVVDGVIQSCSYDFSNTNIAIPIILDGQTVAGIKDAPDKDSGVFANKGITFVNLPATLQTIGDYSFYSNELPVVTIPDSVVAIGTAAFSTNRLTNVKFADTVLFDTIGSSAFSANRFRNVVVPNGVAVIGSSAFAYNRSLASVTMPNTVAEIGSNAFLNTSSAIVTIPTITIPASVEKIGSGAFLNAVLKNIVFEDGGQLKTIGSSAFYSCRLSGKLVIPHGVTSIGAKAFGYNNLSEVYVPNTVVNIYKDAFKANRITRVDFEENSRLESIGMYAFQENTIYAITIPNSVTSIGNGAFNANALKSVLFENESQIQTIGESAFLYNTIDSITLPKSIVSIAKDAFGLNALKSVRFEPESKLQTIEVDAFDGNSSLKSIALPTHANEDFQNYKDGAGNFYDAGDEMTDFSTSYNSIFSPAIVSYTLTDDDVVVVDGVIMSCSYYFAGNLGGTNLTIPDTLDGQLIIGIKSITANYAGVFSQRNIRVLTLPEAIQVIGSCAFYRNALTTVFFPDNVVAINEWAFYFNKITKLEFGKNSQLKTIGNYAFYSNSIAELTIPDCVSEIEDHSFASNSLTSLHIPDSVVGVGNAAFINNYLENVTFGENSHLRAIGAGAFRSSLQSFVLPTHETLSSLGWIDGNGIGYNAGDTVTNFYASYKIPSGYDIDYVLNGGTNNDNNPVLYSKENGVPAFESATRGGFTFDGWYSDSVFTTAVTKINTGSTGDTVLYAKWKYTMQYTKLFRTQCGGSYMFAGKALTASGVYADTIQNIHGEDSLVRTLYLTVEQNCTDSVQTVHLKEGWNLVALYVSPYNPSVRDVFPHATEIKTNSAFWKASYPAYLNGYDRIVVGTGYLIHNAIEETVTINGIKLQPASMALKSGWNLVGIPTTATLPVASLPVEVQSAKNFDSFFEYPSSGFLQTLEPGNAYFLKVNDACEIVW